MASIKDSERKADGPAMSALQITGSTDPDHAQRLLDVLRGDPRKDSR
jgi:hypothetical protein